MVTRERMMDMEQIKVLHCADLHLGAELTSVGEKSGERQGELLRTFRRIADLCRREEVDLLLIAGDLFEGSNVGLETVASVKSYLEGMDTRVFISPGNHDYMSLDSPYAEANWPENVHIFRGAREKVAWPEKKVTVFGAGFESTFVSRSFLSEALELDSQHTNIGIFHGEVITEGGGSRYHPISLRDIEGSGLDYLALGHIHKRTEILRSGQTAYAYPGCPEGRGFDELGEKGVYLGTVAKGRVELRFHGLSTRMFLAEEVDVTGLRTESEVERRILEVLKERHGKNHEAHFYKLTVTGQVAEEAMLPWDQIQAYLRERLHYVKILDQTEMALDLESLAEEITLKGLFLRRMLQRMKEEEQRGNTAQAELVRRAMHFGLKAFEGQVKLHDY